ncbi:hypothetical protein OG730_42170 (plasmid) [Streptomyces sp. NBC_01298]|uniref:hypothetical protein n=1 Tax=Streptomyces sp. NBC_01298 TaxID=2903817 RepID=UPI002E14DEC6|nr:hypothetical protein OG730_42170 [Streptomyces sp. NBC_01298]
MNQYGRIAEQHWQDHRPQHVAELANPEEFFTSLGVDVQREVQERWTSQRMAVSTVVGESHLERLARLTQSRWEIEGEVLRELVLLPADNDPGMGDDPFLSPEELDEEQWREFHLLELIAGRTRAAAFSAEERARLRAGAVPRLLELAGLSDEALRSEGLL